MKTYKLKAKTKNIIFKDSVATFCHINVVAKLDANNNVYPNREKAKNKIDVFMSNLNAFTCYENKRNNLYYYFEEGD
jgi:phage terminase large subunit-like protein